MAPHIRATVYISSSPPWNRRAVDLIAVSRFFCPSYKVVKDRRSRVPPGPASGLAPRRQTGFRELEYAIRYAQACRRPELLTCESNLGVTRHEAGRQREAGQLRVHIQPEFRQLVGAQHP